MTLLSSSLVSLADPWSATHAPDPPSKDDSIGIGITQLLQGETALAQATFGKAYSEAARRRDGERATLTVALGWLAESRHFNAFPQASGADSIELSLRWDGVERARAWQERAEKVRLWKGSTQTALACRWIQAVAAQLTYRSIARHAASLPEKDRLLEQLIRRTDASRADARQLWGGGDGWSIARSPICATPVAITRSRSRR